ncbi:hypothetical protein PanWU01x14_130980 [Parasponia andersonii]|uniref:Uncharacterized protein n=1 Tax=Parasponia andersonii TaxID=3476 RepID=A0A2P5CQV5_PARAD|nr:hypothetical protein PanWU01x14_130980 [Parasponia andersonii]
MGPKTLAANEDELLESREGLGEEGEIIVSDGHPLKVNLLEPGVGLGHGGYPGREVGPPVARHEIEVGEPWLALDRHGLNLSKPSGGAPRRDGVAVADE